MSSMSLVRCPGMVSSENPLCVSHTTGAETEPHLASLAGSGLALLVDLSIHLLYTLLYSFRVNMVKILVYFKYLSNSLQLIKLGSGVVKN